MDAALQKEVMVLPLGIDLYVPILIGNEYVIIGWGIIIMKIFALILLAIQFIIFICAIMPFIIFLTPGAHVDYAKMTGLGVILIALSISLIGIYISIRDNS